MNQPLDFKMLTKHNCKFESHSRSLTTGKVTHSIHVPFQTYSIHNPYEINTVVYTHFDYLFKQSIHPAYNNLCVACNLMNFL